MRSSWGLAAVAALVMAGCGGTTAKHVATPPPPAPEACSTGNHPGGAQITFTATTRDGGQPSADQIQTTLTKLCERLRSSGVAANVDPSGSDQLVVALPQGADAAREAQTLGRPGRLEFF